MEFEFDQRKSESNATKHGIDFIEAQQLWEDPDCLVVPAVTHGEPRFMVIGKIGSRHWSAIVTPREDLIRIISVRRSREREVEAYEN